MKLFLTIYVCSLLSGNCVEVPKENHKYDRFYPNHFECVKKGLEESYAILFDGQIFKAELVNNMELYPKFICQKIKEIEKPKV